MALGVRKFLSDSIDKLRGGANNARTFVNQGVDRVRNTPSSYYFSGQNPIAANIRSFSSTPVPQARSFVQAMNTVSRYNPIQVLGRGIASSALQSGNALKERQRLVNKRVSSQGIFSLPSDQENNYLATGLSKAAETHGKINAPLNAVRNPLATAGAGLIGGAANRLGGGSFRKGAQDAIVYSSAVQPLAEASNPYLAKLLPKGSGFLANRLAPSAANVLQGIGIDLSTGQKTTPMSLAIDAVTGAAGGNTQFNTPNAKGFDFGRTTRSKWHPEDVDLLDEVNTFINQKNLSKDVLDGIDKDVTDLGKGYLPIEMVQGLSNKYKSDTKGFLKAMIGELQKSARSADGSGFKGVVLGAVEDGPVVNRKSIIRDFGRDPDLSIKKQPEIIDENTAKGNILNSLLAEDPTLGQDKNVLQKVKESINGIFNPIRNTSPEFQNTFTKWVNAKMVTRTNANALAQKYKNISPEIAPDVIDYMQGVTTDATPEVRRVSGQLRKEFDALYEEANAAGLDVKYLKDYLTNIWQDSPRDMQIKMQSAGQKFNFANERTIPDYRTGIKIGLTPKFSNPAQILAEYSRRLQTTKANIDLFKDLKDQGVIITAKEAAGESLFKPITAPGFPQSYATDGASTIKGSYYAPKKIADFINNQFSEQEATPILGKLANLSRTMQDISLSGGLPFTPVNAFSIAQAQKEFLAGRPLAPLKAVFHSMTTGMADEYFNAKTATIGEMQSQGIPLTSTLNYEDLFDNQYVKKSLKDKAGEVWGKAFNDPTFQRFMPMLQIQLYEDVKGGLLKKGYAPEEAARIAGQNVKNFYGVVNDQATGRNRAISDSMTALFFAPKYRESMINLWTNTAKLLDPRQTLNPENRTNLKFAIGSMITYASMNALNKAVNGHYMWENPEGKKDKLLVPAGDGTTIGVPFLSSIATVPRAIVGISANLASGNTAEAGKNVFKLASKPVQTFGNVLTNQDYFGNEIYNETDSAATKFGKQAQYVTGQAMQPYIREAGNYTMAKIRGEETKPGYQIASQTLELPLRFYKTESVNNGKFFDEYRELKKVGERYEELKYKKPDEALKFLQKNKDKIDKYNLSKAQIKQAYSTKESTGKFQLPGSNGMSENQVNTDQRNLTKDERDFIRERMRLGDKTVSEKEIEQAYLGKYLEMPNQNKYDKKIRSSKLFSSVSDINNNENLSQSQKDTLLEKVANEVGVTKQQLDYYSIANDNNDLKTKYILDRIEKMPGDQLKKFLTIGRTDVNGSMVVSNGVIDNLVDEGILTKDQGKALKKVKFSSSGEQISKYGSGGGSSSKFITDSEILKAFVAAVKSSYGAVNESLTKPSGSRKLSDLYTKRRRSFRLV